MKLDQYMKLILGAMLLGSSICLKDNYFISSLFIAICGSGLIGNGIAKLTID